METDSRSGWPGKGALEELLCERIRATIETIIEEELEAALGAERSARVGAQRAGYRHGKRQRGLTTRLGATTITMPRGADRRRTGPAPRMARRIFHVISAVSGIV
jgi:transposase-like protein